MSHVSFSSLACDICSFIVYYNKRAGKYKDWFINMSFKFLFIAKNLNKKFTIVLEEMWSNSAYISQVLLSLLIIGKLRYAFNVNIN